MKKYSYIFRATVIPFLLAGAVMACGRPAGSGTEESQPSAVIQETGLYEESVPSETGVPSADGIQTSAPAIRMREIRVVNPGDGYFCSREDHDRKEASIRLEMLMEKPNAITDVEEWFDANQLPELTIPVPNPEWNEAGNLPGFIPETTEDGLRIIQLGQDDLYYYAIYGEGFWDAYFLRIYDPDTESLLCSVDFEAWRYGTRDSGMEQRIWWAQVSKDMLIFSVGHGTYAETMPANAYVAAVSLTDGTLLWKSEPLVSNAYNFSIVGDEILCGYGFTQEPDYLYQLDLFTGRILNQIPVGSKPDYIIQKDDILYVRTYDTNYTFRITGASSGPEDVPAEPPAIGLTDPLSSTISLSRIRPGSYTWTRGEGGVSAIACGPHPLEYPLQEENILTLPRYNGMDEISYYLSCDLPPDRILLREWDSAAAGQTETGPLSMQTLEESFLQLVPGRIYEITLFWDEENLPERGFGGEASYIVATQ